jgi:hypothetical protein
LTMPYIFVGMMPYNSPALPIPHTMHSSRMVTMLCSPPELHWPMQGFEPGAVKPRSLSKYCQTPEWATNTRPRG